MAARFPEEEVLEVGVDADEEEELLRSVEYSIAVGKMVEEEDERRSAEEAEREEK